MVIDRDPSELIPGLGVAPGCKVALAPEVFVLAGPLRLLRQCRVVSARTPVPSASLTIVTALSKEEVPALAVYAQNLADVSALWVAVPRKNAETEGLPPPKKRAQLADLQAVFVPLGLSDNKLLSFGTMLVAYRFVRKAGAPRAVGGPQDDREDLEELHRSGKLPERRASLAGGESESEG